MATFTTLPHPFPPCIVDTADSFDGVDCLPISLIQPRYRVVLAGKCFFHIEETSTGRVRGFEPIITKPATWPGVSKAAPELIYARP